MDDTAPESPVLRPLSDQDWLAASELVELVFHEGSVLPEVREAERSVAELDRTVAAFDGDTLAGMAEAYSLRMTVPGGHQIPVAGVTWVAVRPTHRRRGLLTRLMRRQLEDVRAAGAESVAALWASEAPIYGRFGYGLASQYLDVSIPRAAAALAGAPSGAGLRLRMVAAADSLALTEPVYAAIVGRRPGMLARNKAWAQMRVFDPEGRRHGAGPLQCVLAEDASGVRGYAWYSTVEGWDQDGLPDGTVRVREAGALDTAAYAAIWRFLLDLDLTAKVAARLPVDDPLLHLLADPRKARPRLRDALFVRLVDVPRALADRRYGSEVDVVLDVTDEFCPWNTGRWRLAGGPAGAVCERTTAPADLALTQRELGTAYLGGTSVRALAGAGRVTELRPGALAAASRAFASDIQPFCPFGF